MSDWRVGIKKKVKAILQREVNRIDARSAKGELDKDDLEKLAVIVRTRAVVDQKINDNAKKTTPVESATWERKDTQQLTEILQQSKPEK